MARSREGIEKIIRDCWRRAEHPNTPPAEKELALARAHELMARHQIDEAILQEAEGIREQIVMLDIRIQAEGKPAAVSDQRIFLAHTVASVNRCQCVIRERATTVDVETGKIITGGTFFTVVGYKSDTEFVGDLYWQLVMVMMSEVMNEKVQTKSYQASFCDGFVARIRERLQEINRKVEHEKAAEGSSTALVLADRSLAVRNEFEQMFPNLHKQKVYSYKVDPNAVERGRRAADKTDLGQTKIGETTTERKAIR